MGWLARLNQVFDPEPAEQDLDDELRFHLEMEIQQQIERGKSPGEARRIALLSFGGMERIKEEVRDVDRIRFIENLLQDFKFTLRQAWKRPGFSLLAVITLALGIGANTAIFSAIDGVLLAPLPYREGHELVHLKQSAPRDRVERLAFSIPELADYRSRVHSLVDIAEFHDMSFVLLGREEPERVHTGVVSDNFFTLLGVEPWLGRLFAADDNRAGQEAPLVLSHHYWKRSFGADPAVIGRQFAMNDRPHRVIGVLPPLPGFPEAVDVYMPTSACPFRSLAVESTFQNRSAFRSLEALARIRPGFSLEQVNAELTAVTRSFEVDYPEVYGKGGLRTEVLTLQEELTWQARPTLYLLLATTGLVLLIACANVANLLLTDWLRRQRETAVRVVMGAGRGRLLGQALVESLSMSLAGGVLGLLIASGGLDLLKAFTARFTQRAEEISINPGVLFFTLGLSVLSGVIFALLPVLAMGRERQLPSLKAGQPDPSGPSGRLRNVLIVGQVAVSCMLLIFAGLTLRSLLHLQRIDPGYRTENVLSAALSINWSRYESTQEARVFFQRVLDRLESEPGVLAAAVGNIVPLTNQTPANFTFEIAGRPQRQGEIRPRVDIRFVSREFFSTIRLPLQLGRLFNRADQGDHHPVAIVSESFARTYWPNQRPLGQRVRFSNGAWREIVGIVGDARLRQLSVDSTAVIYVPLMQDGYGSSFLVRTISDPAVMERRIKEIVYQVDPEQPLTSVRTLDQLRRESIASPRLTTLLLGLFALLALIITLSGISGVIALAVKRRTHEIGIRMALGAHELNVLVLVLAQGLTLVLVGLGAGLAISFLSVRAFSGIFFGVGPTDPLTYFTVAGLFLLVSVVTCLLPARRATAIDPLRALRAD